MNTTQNMHGDHPVTRCPELQCARAERTYTRAEVERAVNGGADLVESDDKTNLIVNAQLTLLDDPNASLDDVILANWQAEGDETDEELIERVKGWSDLS